MIRLFCKKKTTAYLAGLQNELSKQPPYFFSSSAVSVWWPAVAKNKGVLLLNPSLALTLAPFLIRNFRRSNSPFSAASCIGAANKASANKAKVNKQIVNFFISSQNSTKSQKKLKNMKTFAKKNLSDDGKK